MTFGQKLSLVVMTSSGYNSPRYVQNNHWLLGRALTSNVLPGLSKLFGWPDWELIQNSALLLTSCPEDPWFDLSGAQWIDIAVVSWFSSNSKSLKWRQHLEIAGWLLLAARICPTFANFLCLSPQDKPGRLLAQSHQGRNSRQPVQLLGKSSSSNKCYCRGRQESSSCRRGGVRPRSFRT